MSEMPLKTTPKTAMVLAAGFGERMRPLTDKKPKPLVEVAGKPLIEHVLDKLADAGVETAVVNVHYLADMIEKRLASRKKPRIVFSDERKLLLNTGGGIVKALPLIGAAPFYLVNSDSIWIDGVRGNLARLGGKFRPGADGCASSARADRRTASVMQAAGISPWRRMAACSARAEREVVPFVYAGVAILSPSLFKGAPDGAFSLTTLFDRASEAERLFGLRLEGVWMHVGTPDAIALAEDAILASAV